MSESGLADDSQAGQAANDLPYDVQEADAVAQAVEDDEKTIIVEDQKMDKDDDQ
jgi:hypothetical protein